ncbi:MAG: energy-coupling factor transporter transmembrane protein EcfT [Actinobacteria bacterium]|nr:energy-coupling factor transporter transmembrane protein EcfT [Actinomycetota bacterium]MCA1721353.1 energy-coupling factor transporter transmembrane protein EcfT [Actinomycetota bacterium]
MTALPRALHPMAWWVWALGVATAASRTTNPLLLGVLVAVLGYVVVTRRGDAPWARAFRAYLVLGLFVVVLRVSFNAVLGAGIDGHVLVTLPRVGLPNWAQGIDLGGPVTAEEVLAAAYDGLRLAALLCCVGAANALANPKRALRSLPPALYEVGVAVVVALTVAPQLVESVLRVRRARRLRGAQAKGLRAVRAVAVPVLEDALARSLMLAAAMDSRGYGRSAHVPARQRRATAVLVVGGLLGLCLGLYGLLDATAPRTLGYGALALGLALSAAGLVLGGRRIVRSTYRPDPWRAPEWLVAGSGAACALLMVGVGSYDPLLLHPSLYPLRWPELPLLPLLAVLLGLLPAFAAPQPVRPRVRVAAA